VKNHSRKNEAVSEGQRGGKKKILSRYRTKRRKLQARVRLLQKGRLSIGKKTLQVPKSESGDTETKEEEEGPIEVRYRPVLAVKK